MDQKQRQRLTPTIYKVEKERKNDAKYNACCDRKIKFYVPFFHSDIAG